MQMQRWDENCPLVIVNIPGLQNSPFLNPLISKCANAVIDGAGISKYRLYTFQQMSQNNWCNTSFENYVILSANYFLMRVRNSGNPIMEMESCITQIYNGLVAKNALEGFSNELNPVQMQDSAQLLDGLNNIMLSISNQTGYRNFTPQANTMGNNFQMGGFNNQGQFGAPTINSFAMTDTKPMGFNRFANGDVGRVQNTGSAQCNEDAYSGLNRFQQQVKEQEEADMEREKHQLFGIDEKIPSQEELNRVPYQEPPRYEPKSDNYLHLGKPENLNKNELSSIKNSIVLNNDTNAIYTDSFSGALIDILCNQTDHVKNMVGMKKIVNVKEFHNHKVDEEDSGSISILDLFADFASNVNLTHSDIAEKLSKRPMGLLLFKYMCALMTKEINSLFDINLEIPNIIDGFYTDKNDLIQFIKNQKSKAAVETYDECHNLIDNWKKACNQTDEIKKVLSDSSNKNFLAEEIFVINTLYRLEDFKKDLDNNAGKPVIFYGSSGPIEDNNYRGLSGKILQAAHEAIGAKPKEKILILTEDFALLEIKFIFNIAVMSRYSPLL